MFAYIYNQEGVRLYSIWTQGRLLYLESSIETSARYLTTTVSKQDAQVWHKGLGHAGQEALNMLGIPGDIEPCETCASRRCEAYALQVKSFECKTPSGTTTLWSHGSADRRNLPIIHRRIVTEGLYSSDVIQSSSHRHHDGIDERRSQEDWSNAR